MRGHEEKERMAKIAGNHLSNAPVCSYLSLQFGLFSVGSNHCPLRDPFVSMVTIASLHSRNSTHPECITGVGIFRAPSTVSLSSIGTYLRSPDPT